MSFLKQFIGNLRTLINSGERHEAYMESKIFSAQEAREQTDKINEAEEEMVIKRINRAISKGRYKAIISKPLQESTINSLINNGYTVNQDTYGSDEVLRVIIKW